jgi:hypothetical protein
VRSRVATVSRHAKMRAFKISQAINQFIGRLPYSLAGNCRIGASMCARGARNWDKARFIGSTAPSLCRALPSRTHLRARPHAESLVVRPL